MKYKLFKGCLSVIFISCLFFYSGCIDECDGEEGEPILYVSFVNAKSYTRVYGLNGKEKNTHDYPSTQFSVPVSIKDDSTIVVFESNTNTANDTLTIRYKRTVKMESQRCGFRLFLDDFEIIEPTTFTRLPDDVSYYTNELYVYIDE